MMCLASIDEAGVCVLFFSWVSSSEVRRRHVTIIVWHALLNAWFLDRDGDNGKWHRIAIVRFFHKKGYRRNQ